MLSKIKYSPILIGALISVAVLLYGIFTSTNSTASIGFLFLPVYALVGALLGGLVEHIYFLITKKRQLVSKPTAVYLAVLLMLIAFIVNKLQERQQLAKAADPNTASMELRELLQKRDSALQRLVLSNPSLPVADVRSFFTENKTKYDVASDVIHGPHLEKEMISEMVQLIPESFPSKVEYELYQTFVWAPLVRKKLVSPEQIHLLAAKTNPQHFLILALLESNDLTCEEKKKFLPQSNAVLESAITHSMTQSGCP